MRHRAVEETSDIACASVQLPQVDGVTEIRIAVSFAGGKQMRCTLFFVPQGAADPLPFTFSQSKTIADLRGGHCLLVPVSDDMEWTDNVWPKSIQELDGLVSDSTGSLRFFETWVEEKSRASNKLLMVVAIRSNCCYGYLLGSPKIAGYSETRVIPVFFDRVGELALDFPVPFELALSSKNLEALIKHARSFQPHSGDTQEDLHLRQALDEMANTLEKCASGSQQA
ncbi:hypothetical protein [Pseudomonas sp.]|uniref:hypothetical protein n=1 Tax=Pseudomonas sp. TaxID=306 RepID=UPI002FCC137B